ncbi:DEAD/DEAH box helicase [Paenibacillus ginsengarvi]|uniref:DEAD/DEAH box helicase n=1 Tax=Paenibacillus ginsengarvi TaxID=400777 RepID=A0A3B0CK13_9BACL|nr:DEAD/DEAH box helicase [Paenibacillus ginsengarvi]RKN85350.1 DEAD/DEAH box helicase [Paenibacillus ginsengarvi]
MNHTFETLGIGPGLAEVLEKHGITEPSPVQAEAIPAALAGGDLLAQSQTGTGKTLAYLLPILQQIDPTLKELQAIVLVPTRELGVQIAAEIEKYGGPAGIRGQALIGGAALSRQVERLKLHPHMIAGTPGRIAELLRMRKVKLHRVRTIVIDEADQMFALGAAKEAENIIESAMRDRQLLFFSATLTTDVRRLAGRWMREPREIEIDPGVRTAGGIEHLVFVCQERDKLDTLRRLVRLYDPRSALVFVNELDVIAEVAAKLQYAGLSADALYGDAPKQERTTLLNRFRTGKLRTLVATDVAARGLDIEGLTHVFHLQPALDADHYVHRAGRTGRMGRSGLSVSIATEQEMFIIRKFEKQLGIVIHRKAMYKGQVVEPHEARGPAVRSVGKLAGSRPAAPRKSEEASAGLSSAAGKAARGEEPSDSSAQSRQPDVSSLRSRSGGFRTMGAASLRNEKEKTRSGGPSREKAGERERDRKNKGAPRWLKEKQERDPKS